MTERTIENQKPQRVRSLKVALHAHSVWSYDGSWELNAIAKLFGRFGVDVVMMSEHDDGFSQDRFEAFQAACAEASTSHCLLVPGIEYSCPKNDIHILVWGSKRFFGEHRPVMDTLADVSAEGAVAILAHPHRRDIWKQYDNAWTPHLSGIEIWNRKTDGVAPGPEALKLAARTGLPQTLGVDFHRINQTWPLTHAIKHSDQTLELSILNALRSGRARPQAFGRDLVNAEGQIETARLARAVRAETFRRKLKKLLGR